MYSLKLLTWNIRQGGKKAIHQIVDALITYNTDLMVITEYKENPSGKYLTDELYKKGWNYIASSQPPNKENGVLIASKYPLEKIDPSFSPHQGSHRWNEVYIPSYDLFLLGVHVPNVNEKYDKQFHWDQVLHYAKQKEGSKCVIAGDFNTARRDEKEKAPRIYSSYISTLIDKGWVDAWKNNNENSNDFTWYSTRNNGFRLDYMFISPVLAVKLYTSYLSHHERMENYSDHSLLISELRLTETN
ncbi:endonuclease/exonuclease/phosphatase family protein [Virgibacillus doumboii]|uniref:endonuclease/exonuclease/phosphatase family protein n=1 Tax=Virgibacillus doumboii TaxID=2697503 RepID=UPI0013DF55FA|nr:endonuclease/exonuclease/phosphatase family protein [Virgibacillus doumboii]